MAANNQRVIMKGRHGGLTLQLDDQCSFSDLLAELEEELSVNAASEQEPMIKVSIQLGARYLTEDQKRVLTTLIREKQKLVVESIESDVIKRTEALSWKENTDITPVVKTVRSGQVTNVRGDLLLIGDVNPGGQIQATGNIFVLGRLKGIAHAGTEGDSTAVIAASYMQPTQLRIADQFSRSPDYESEGVYMECGFIDDEEEKIRVDRIQEVVKKRPDLANFERRMDNG
ncbi:septum site-determining protein MinC [Halobacillus fulvus]|nr:septum site-determining protein MinC [Halobacillus fulvus]